MRHEVTKETDYRKNRTNFRKYKKAMYEELDNCLDEIEEGIEEAFLTCEVLENVLAVLVTDNQAKENYNLKRY